jgi:hypothetical protein
MGLAWGASSLGAVAFGYGLVAPANYQHQILEWSLARSFPPGSLGGDLWWPLQRIWAEYRLLGQPGAVAVLLAALGLVGLASLIAQRRDAGLVLAGPLATTFLAAVLHRYPFSFRTTLFLVPALGIALAAGADWLLARLAGRRRHAAALGMAALAALPLWRVIVDPPVYRLQDTKRLFEYVRDHREPGDRLYVYYGAWQAFAYYGPRYGWSLDEATIGDCFPSDVRGYLRELDRFRGEPRVWVVFVHSVGFEERAIMSYLLRIGRLVDEVAVSGRIRGQTMRDVHARLFDLSDPGLLARSSAESQPLEGIPSRRRWNACQGPSAPPSQGYARAEAPRP